MNEVTNIILLYHLFLFTDWIEEPEMRYKIGWSFIGVTVANMLVHFSLMLYESCKQLCGKIQEKCCPTPPEPVKEEQPVVEKKKQVLTVIEEVELESSFSDESSKKSPPANSDS
mmetsp:Transcript_27618/g.34281  ORF Transcript_27618/g.34281 Transcript_27618/m.34281 type:complete len:114 (-) Transcript_27618:682-1023(-)